MLTRITKTIVRMRTVFWMSDVIFHGRKEIFHAVAVRCFVKSLIKPRKRDIMIMVIMRNNQLTIFIINDISCIIWHYLNRYLFSRCHTLIDCLCSLFLRLFWIRTWLLLFLFRSFRFQILFRRFTLRF